MQDKELLEIVNKIDTSQIIKVVQDLVKMPSITPPGKEESVAEYIKKFMHDRNIPTDIMAASPNRYNVISRIKGKGEADPVIITGHMDVVPVGDEERKLWLTDPFGGEIINGYLHGRGSVDMKGGLGAAMVAMGNVASSGILPPGDIIFVATVDEEDFMRGAKALLESELIADAKKVIVCEPSNLELQTCSRGRTWADVTVKGMTAHASRQGAGINAIKRAVLLMNRMADYQIPYEEHRFLGESFWQINLISGGIEPAMVPDSCTITVDARLVPGQMPQDIWDELEKLVNQIKIDVPDFKADINIIEAREPWETPADDWIIKNLKEAYHSLQIPLKESGFLATSDGTIFRRMGMEAVIVGPGDLALAHKENEKVAVEQLIQATKLYMLTMLKC